jgi:hypothetical protein
MFYDVELPLSFIPEEPRNSLYLERRGRCVFLEQPCNQLVLTQSTMHWLLQALFNSLIGERGQEKPFRVSA